MFDFKDLKNKPYINNNLKQIREEYKKFRDMSLPELEDALFDSFYITGQRIEYEKRYFARRGALLMSAVMSLVYGETEHIEALKKNLNAICEEKTWALPAHTPKGETHPERVIDLFAAETGHALVEICEFIGDAIPDELSEKIRYEVRRRIIDPFIEVSFSWERETNNWAAVCGGAVGMTFLHAFRESFGLVEKRIIDTLECYISGFGDDGITTEGMGYWSYGFWYFTGFADMYKKYCGVDLMARPKVKRIAMCQQNMFLCGETVISYGDCMKEERYNRTLAHYYRNLYGNDIKIISDKLSSGIDECYRILPCLRTLMWTDQRLISIKESMEVESYFCDCQWYVNRRYDLAFTAKCGNNGGSHNHNDIGSFIIADGKGQLIADYGSGEYTHDYFSNRRYEFAVNSSRGHSVPIIDGEYQCAGEEYKGRVIREEKGLFEIDIAGAYAADLKSLRRRFTVNSCGVELNDSFVFDDDNTHHITERFISVIKPEMRGKTAYIGELMLECNAAPVITAEKIRNHFGQEDAIYYIDYIANDDFKIKFTYIKDAR